MAAKNGKFSKSQNEIAEKLPDISVIPIRTNSIPMEISTFLICRLKCFISRIALFINTAASIKGTPKPIA